MRLTGFCALLGLLSIGNLSCKEDTTEPKEEVILTTPSIALDTLVTDRGIIWGFDFLDENTIIFTEKTGRIFTLSNGKTTELSGLPNDISSEGQGGLLDICVHPNYKSNGWIYTCYSSVTGGSGTLNLIRFKLNGNSITDVESIFKTTPGNTWKGHYGSRIVFDNNGFLFLSVGEGGTTSYGGEKSPNQNAQNTSVAWGKVHRMTDAGKVPSDNPILTGQTAPSTIWSYGHRNPQGLVLNPTTNEVYETEHGPKGGDEFNLIKKGLNYGWPWVSHGVNYDGSKISDSPFRDGMENAIHFWTPSTGTCGVAYISTTKYGNWQGSFVCGGLALRNVTRLLINPDQKTADVTTIFDNIGRVRNVKTSPDGYVYLSVEAPGRLLKLVPSF